MRFIGPDGSTIHLSLTADELERVNAIVSLMLDQHAARQQFGDVRLLAEESPR